MLNGALDVPCEWGKVVRLLKPWLYPVLYLDDFSQEILYSLWQVIVTDDEMREGEKQVWFTIRVTVWWCKFQDRFISATYWQLCHQKTHEMENVVEYFIVQMLDEMNGHKLQIYEMQKCVSNCRQLATFCRSAFFMHFHSCIILHGVFLQFFQLCVWRKCNREFCRCCEFLVKLLLW